MCDLPRYHQGDDRRRAATGRDQYTLAIEEAALRYEHADHPRTARTIQRYCAKGHLDCLRQETPFGEKYLITPESVARHIAQIEELASATRRDLSWPAALPLAAPEQAETQIVPSPTSPDMPRPVAADYQTRYLDHLEKENAFLREQNTVLLERVKETNILTGRLQEMLSPLLGRGGDPQADQPHRES